MIVYNSDKIKKEVKELLKYNNSYVCDITINEIINIVLSNVKNKTITEIIEYEQK